MRTLIASVFLLGFTSFLVAAEIKYDSKDGKFTAKFPGEEKPTTITKKSGALDMVITSVEVEKSAYAVIYSDLPVESVNQVPLTKMLEGGEKTFTENLKAKVTKSSEIKFKGNGKEYAAREFVATKDDMHFRVRIMLIDNRLYQIFVIGDKKTVSSETAEDFLKSFDLK